jgi:AraC-like DNA-binding protein
MHIQKYSVKNPILKNIISCFWVANQAEPICINHKLLPVSSIDLILNFSVPIQYSSKTQQVNTKGFHFSGPRNTYCQVQQSGNLDLIGISFKPFGLYPLVKIPITAFTNQAIDLDLLNNELSEKLADRIAKLYTTRERLAKIEEVLLEHIDLALLPDNTLLALLNRLSLEYNLRIDEFCGKYGIHKRTLERRFNKYAGLCPKTFVKIARFQKLLKVLAANNYQDLTTLAYTFDYYDQTHFVKDFKGYTGSSPLTFLRDKISVKQIITYS